MEAYGKISYDVESNHKVLVGVKPFFLQSGDPERFSTAELRVLDLTGEEPSEVLIFDPPEEFRNQ